MLTKPARALAATIIVLSLVYLAVGNILFYEYHRAITLFAGYGIQDAHQTGIDSVAHLQRTLLGGSILFLLIGSTTFSIGINLYRAKEWARKAWLGMTLLLALFHLLRLMNDHYEGTFWTIERTMELVLVILLATVSWKVFSSFRILSS